MCFRNCPTDFMGVKSRGLLSLRTNLFLFFTNGGREHQTAQLLRHAVSNHVIRTPYRDNRIQARRVQASGHPLGFCVAKSEQSKKTPRKFSKSRFPLASRYVFLSKPLRETYRIVVLGKALLTFPVLSLRAVGCPRGWVAVCSGDRLHPGEPVLVGHPTTGKGVWLPSAI